MSNFRLTKTERAELDKAIAAVEQSLSTLSELIDATASEWEEEWDGKSEKWQEGDKGQAAREKVDAMRALFDELPTADDITGIDLDQFAA